MLRKCISIFNLNVDTVTREELLTRVHSIVNSGKKAKIMYANIHTMNLAYNDPECRNALNCADLVYCDGEGVRWGARILGKFLPQRMTGADWIWDLCKMCEEKSYSLYLLGGKSGVAEKAAKKLREKFPNLRVTGAYHGYFQKYGEENDEVIGSINKAEPDILLVGFGSPLQEKWICNNFEKLDPHVIWAVGAVMDFVSGKVRRGPRWMLDNGMEWVFRLIVEPRRMWKRYIIGNIIFFKRIIQEKLSAEHKYLKRKT